VKEAVNTTIDNVLNSLPERKVKEHLDRLKVLASPLWTYDTQGYNSIRSTLDKFFVVGVGNRDTSILSQTAAYKTHFDTNEHQASFASTNQNDRVCVLAVEDLLPIYAVNNFSSYRRDNDEKVARGFMMANYLDEKLNNRINSENFNVMPTIEADNILRDWVYGFIFGYIHFDREEGTYWIRSKTHGDALRDFRFNLNAHRDVAYDLFKSEHIYEEVEAALDRQIAKNGRQPIEDKLKSIEEDSTYREYAQLSPLEADNIYDPKFKAVRELFENEIRLMSE
jgi:hypothetical protein